MFKLTQILVKVLILCTSLCVLNTCAFSQNNANSNSAFLPKSISEIDSLNESAFRAKRTNILTALNQLASAQKAADQLNYTKGLAVSLLYEAGIYQQSGYTNKALTTYYKALEISKKNNDSFNVARCNLQIAGTLTDNNKYTEAASLYNQSLQTFKQLKHQRQVINVINAIGQMQLSRDSLEAAIKEFNTALLMSIDIKYKYGEKKANQNLGLAYLKQNKLAEAESFFNKAILMDETEKDYYGLAFTNSKLSTIAYRKRDFKNCLFHATEGYAYAKKANANSLAECNITCIISAYSLKNNATEIMHWQDSLIGILKEENKLDKEYAANFIDLIREEEAQTYLAKQKANQAANQSKIRLALIVLGSVFLLISSIFSLITYKNFKRQKALSKQLAEQNTVIEQNNLALDDFNKAISYQNKRLEEENKMKDKLLSIISHDLRHPMINTKAIVELINAGLVTPEETKELMTELEAQYVRSITLLDNLLYWLRGQMQGKGIDLQTLNVSQLILGIIQEQELNYKKKNIQINNTITSAINVVGDAEMLKVVFRNLINNAIKFTPEAGEIKIGYSKQNQFHCFFITDSGIGIEKEEIEKINQNNYYSTIGTSQEKGTGFGIMLCKDLITKHNGELIIESEKAKGSTFTIKLPII